MFKSKNQNGFIAFFITALVLMVMIAIAASAAILLVATEKTFITAKIAGQSYYAAESGLEDALLKLKKIPSITTLNYNMLGNPGTVNITISDTIGGARTIIAQANVANRIKRVRVVYKIDATGISFHYGAQIGDGGLVMGGNSRVMGNVFSDGSIIASNGARVDDNVIVARNGNKIDNLIIGGDAMAYSCEDADISGNLVYVQGGHSTNCDVAGSTTVQADEIVPEDLPIDADQINEWQAEALAGGVINNDVIYTNGATATLGPIQIGTPSQPKNLTLSNGADLKITGTIYVTGNINVSNNAIVELDISAYGSFGGTIIAGGKINTSNNAVLKGTGGAGSYLLVLSTNNSVDPVSPAIMVSNNATGAIFYASNGMIYLNNNMKAREITGYKVQLNNNAEIQYDSGLQNSLFTSGPGGGWKIEDWREIE